MGVIAGYLPAIGWALLAIVGAYIARFVFSRWLRSVVKKTKTNLDDKLLSVLELPIYYIFLLVGVYFAATALLPDTWQGYVEVFIKVVAVLVVGKAVKNILVDVLFVEYIRRFPAPESSKDRLLSVKGMIDTLVYIIVVLVALSAVGIDVWPILAPLGVGGVALAFAVKDIASNYMAGLILVTEKQFRKGQCILVKEKGVEGRIITVGWRSTHIRTAGGEDVFIPNSTVLNSTIIIKKGNTIGGKKSS